MATIPTLIRIEEQNVTSVLEQAAGKLDVAGELVLDFSSVRRIDSSAVRALEEFARIADEKSAKVVVRGVSVDVYKVLKLVKLARRFSFANE